MLPFEETEEERRIVEVLWLVDGWPIDGSKDLPFIRELGRVYPTIDLHEEAVAWSAWMSEHEQKKSIKYRARFRNWVKNAERFRNERNRKVARHRGPETEGHGDDVGATREW